jgi:hypothetical protein
MQRMMSEGYRSRRSVASYGTYAEAQRAVDRLADDGFPVERLSKVARDSGYEERVAGRKGYGRAALEGTGLGAFPGAAIGFFFGFFGFADSLVSGLVVALSVLLFGALLGAVFGALSHALSGGGRDFASVGGMRADSYDVEAEAEVAEAASRHLFERPSYGNGFVASNVGGASAE